MILYLMLMLILAGYNHIHKLLDFIDDGNGMVCVVSVPHECSLETIKYKPYDIHGNGKFRLDPYDLEDWMMIAKQLFQGIDYMHFMGILHRDLHRGNIFCDMKLGTSRIKNIYISDFGVAVYKGLVIGTSTLINDLKGCIRLLNTLIDIPEDERSKIIDKELLLSFAIEKDNDITKLDEFLKCIGVTRSDSEFQPCWDLKKAVSEFELPVDKLEILLDRWKMPVSSQVIRNWIRYSNINKKRKRFMPEHFLDYLRFIIMYIIRKREHLSEVKRMFPDMEYRDFLFMYRNMQKDMDENKEILDRYLIMNPQQNQMCHDKLDQIQSDKDAMLRAGIPSVEKIDEILQML
jgi:serine/threonine protein kinase